MLELQALPLERMKGIEPSYPAWEAGVLPLNYIRKVLINEVYHMKKAPSLF